MTSDGQQSHEPDDAHGPAVIRDKRRLDPETGQVRTEASAADAGEDLSQAGVPGAEEPATGPGGPDGAGDTGDPVVSEGDLADELARAKAEIYNSEQRFSSYVRRSRNEVLQARTRGQEEVVQSLIGVLDDIDLARTHGELSGPFASIADKLEGVLTRDYAMSRFGETGETFDPNVHEALMHSQSPDVESEQVQQVLQPGYKVGDRVVRPARVAVVSPE